MTEAFEDGIYLVRVRAQVMTRDDSTGGWVPMGGGGLSNVSVRKRIVHPTDTDTKHEYLIFGKRIADTSKVVLSCVIKKDFEYNKVMPTFHHWKTGDKKFGLTFQTAADARAFDKGVRTAVEELLDELRIVRNWINLFPKTEYFNEPAFYPAGVTKDRLRLAVTLPPQKFHPLPDDVGDDDVFMTLNLPVERGDSRSSSDSSSGRHHAPVPPPHHHLPPPPPLPPPHSLSSLAPAPGDESYSYVQLTGHDYTYPVSVFDQHHHDAKKASVIQPTQPHMPPKRSRRCRHCQQIYTSDTNLKGACRYAPDPIRETIDRVACIACARCCLVYPEGRGAGGGRGATAAHPCDCDCDGDAGACGRRWLALALLSLLVPCLWCYPPLRACHLCGIACGMCGATHRPDS
ncbi:sprouty-related, EVH1 domain-containing protein 1 isoform X2 [Nilaparvata lugens]|uniref:sprouty-related, EVH1 domain-containing protein 1 isoform X2 n=1 Tax=Nilaparvata lugens TaxID=108931 RepID=UPI00193D96E8|nr:sprouty-related, EVH1 domain-containing protein 1 isoform X2 [Nilaparvata lugens]